MTESVAVRKARLTVQWRFARLNRLCSLGGSVSIEDIEEAEYVHRMALLDLEEECERQTAASTGGDPRPAPGGICRLP